MTHKTTTLLFFGLLVSLPGFGQSSLLISKTQLNFDPPTGQIAWGDSNTYTYNNLHQKIAYTELQLGNGTGGNWVGTQRGKDFIYDANGNNLYFLQQQTDINQNWYDSGRFTNTYTADGKKLTALVENWNGTGWGIFSSDSLVYDAGGNLIIETKNNDKYFNTYNAQGLLETQIDQYISNGSWTNYSRTQYEYLPSDTLLMIRTIDQWSGSSNSWEGSSRKTYTYDSNKHVVEILSENWNGSAWGNASRISYTNNAHGDVLHHLLQWWGSTDWTNIYQYFYTYDAEYKQTDFLRQDWTAGKWENTYRQFNTYDAASNFTLARGEQWNGSIWQFAIFDRMIYSTFVSTQLPVQSVFELFPNPTSGVVALKSKGLDHVMIVDQQGRVICTQRLQGQLEENLSLGFLPAGNYYLQVTGKNGETGVKPLMIRGR